MKDSLDIVIHIHNLLAVGRKYDRVVLSIESLKRQDFNKIIIVNSSNDSEYFALCEMIRQYDFVDHIHVPAEKLNMSRLSNIGIHRSTAEWILRTDADYLFSPDMLYHAKNERRENLFLLKQVRRLPKMNMSPQRVASWSFPVNSFQLWEKEGDGAFQYARRDWFVKVGGYDERMDLYGVMDNDMHQRALWDGLEIKWIEGGDLLHQWHPNVWHSKPDWHANFNKNGSLHKDKYTDENRIYANNGNPSK